MTSSKSEAPCASSLSMETLPTQRLSRNLGTPVLSRAPQMSKANIVIRREGGCPLVIAELPDNPHDKRSRHCPSAALPVITESIVELLCPLRTPSQQLNVLRPNRQTTLDSAGEQWLEWIRLPYETLAICGGRPAEYIRRLFWKQAGASLAASASSRTTPKANVSSDTDGEFPTGQTLCLLFRIVQQIVLIRVLLHSQAIWN